MRRRWQISKLTIASGIIQNCEPGAFRYEVAEVQFLRIIFGSVHGEIRQASAACLRQSVSEVRKRARTERLAPVNEVAVTSLDGGTTWTLQMKGRFAVLKWESRSLPQDCCSAIRSKAAIEFHESEYG